jgi:tetratricopeptide (TPR) repeat protein
MNKLRSPLFVVSVICALGIVFGAGCHPNPPPPNSNVPGNSTPPKTANSPAPDSEITPVSSTAIADEAMILSVTNDVSIKRQGAASFVPILRNVAFRIGDLLQIGNNSTAKVLCSARGICQLAVGTYTACCTDSCKVEIQMLRAGNTGNPLPVVKRADLPPNEAAQLNQSENSIRQLQLGPVATQFLITKLYSGWKLEETKEELDHLQKQLAKPEAQEELKDLYLPVIRKTGDMQLKINNTGKAKELYELNINSAQPDSNEKAAAHERLGQLYTQSGDQKEAVRNLEKAHEIYLKQGDKNAAAATEKQIVTTRALGAVEQPSPAGKRGVAVKPRPQ